MHSNVVNLYGDTTIVAGSGHGIDVASQRADDLDLACLEFVQTLLAKSSQVRAADIGCGHGSFALRMARAGATVECLDLVDQFELTKRMALAESLAMYFHVGDIRDADKLITQPVSAVLCQRTIHYLDYQSALVTITKLKSRIAPGGKLFISASGIYSELGNNYAHSALNVTNRYAPLSEQMAAKHKIFAPVCLYSETDMETLLAAAGFIVEHVYSSPFGNVKAVARHG